MWTPSLSTKTNKRFLVGVLVDINSWYLTNCNFFLTIFLKATKKNSICTCTPLHWNRRFKNSFISVKRKLFLSVMGVVGGLHVSCPDLLFFWFLSHANIQIISQKPLIVNLLHWEQDILYYHTLNSFFVVIFVLFSKNDLLTKVMVFASEPNHNL